MVERTNAVRRRARVRTSMSRIRRFFNRRNYIFGGVAALVVVFGLLFASAPSVQGYSISNTDEIITSTGGGGYRSANCPTGSIIYAIGGDGFSSDAVVTEPEAYCTGLNTTATGLTGLTGILGGAGWGSQPTHIMGVYTCPQVLVGLVVHKTANGYVSGWSKICGSLPSGSSRVTDSTVFGWSNAGTSSPSQRETIQCPIGMVAVGMVAHTGSVLDKIGLRCGTITGAAQVAVTVTSTTGTFGSTVALASSGGSGAGAVSYAVTTAGTAGCSVSGTTLSASAAGTCTVTATKAADTNYNASSSSATQVTFNMANQTITFTNPGTKERSTTPFASGATASSGQPVSIASSTIGVCTTSVLNITMVTTGTCTIVASQGGNGNYNAATDVSRTFTIQDTTAPTVSSTAITSSAGADSTYIAGDTIQATVNFSETVNVTGTPSVTFVVDSTNRTASYVSGTGTTALVFSYTVVSGDTDTNGIVLTANSLSVTGATIRDASSNNATLSHLTIAASLSHLVDTTAPTVSITRSGSGTLISGQTTTVTFTFTEAVTGFDSSDIQRCPTGSIGGTFGTVSGSGSTYTVVFTPTANLSSGNPSICIGPGAVSDIGGNLYAVWSSILGIPVDTRSPTVSAFTSSAADGTYASGSTIAISATTSEAIQSGNTLTVTLDTGATVTLTAASAGTSLTGTYTVGAGQSSSDLTVSSFTIGTVADTAGNAMTSTAVPSGTSNIAGAKAIVVDGVLPTVTAFSSSTADGTYAIGATVNISATTSEAIRSSNTLTVTLETGATDRTVLLTAASAGTSLTGTYTVQSGDTTSDLTVASFTIGTVADTAGNAMTATTVPSGASNIAGSKAIVIDGVVPTMTVVASPASVSSAGASTVTFTASEATSTFALADVSATLGTLSNFQSVSSTVYTATFTAAQSVGGTAVVTVASGLFTDTIGNASTSAFTGSVTVTNTSSSSGGRVTAQSGGTNFIIERFTTVGTSTLTVPRGVTSIEYLIVGGGGAGGTAYQDASAGGGGGGQVTSGTRSVTANETYTIFVGRGGTASTGSPNPGGDGVWSRIATSGDVTVALGLGGGGGSSFKTGPAGYASTTGYTGGGGGSWATHLSIGSTGTGGSLYKGGNAFGDGFSSDPQAAGGGGGAGGAGSNAVSSVSGNGGVGVASSITGSEVKYGGGGGGGKRSSAGSAGTGIDGGGNGGRNATGVAGTNFRGGGGGGGGGSLNVSGGVGGSGIVVVRYALPSVSVPDLDATDDLGSSSTDNITSATTLTFTGSAPVGSTVQLYVDGVISGSTCTANATTGLWSCDTGVLTAGDKVVTAESTTYLASSTETSTSTGLTVTVDTTAPTVSFSASSTTLRSGQTSTLTFTLSEASTNFVVGDITVSGGTLSSFAGSGTSYTVSFTPTANTQSGSGSVSVALGTFTDAAANNNTASSATTITYDTQAATVSSLSVTSSAGSDNTYVAGDSIRVTVNFSESVTVTSTPTISVLVGVTTRSATYISGSGTSALVFGYTVVSGDNDTDGVSVTVNSLALSGGAINDAAGNASTLAQVTVSASTSHKVDTTAPTVTIAATSTSLRASQTSTLTFTLSESASDFAVGDITVTGGTLSSFTAVSGTSYTVVYTPTANTQTGSGSVSVASGAFTDAAGNTSAASLATSITYDTQAPSVVSIVAGTSTLKSGETSTLTITLSEASSNLIVTDITVTGGTLSSFTGVSSTSYTVVFTPAANTQSGSGSVSVVSSAFTDTAGNTNTASSTTSLTYDTQLPTVSNVTSSSTNGTFTLGGTVSIQVEFSEVVTVSGIPRLTLETGSTDRAVDYVSGSGTTTLTFTYTVQTGDSSSDLDYASTSSLALNGGSIVDAAENAATLTLAAPGTTGSLAANKAIVVTSAPTKVVSVRTPVGTASGAAFTTQPQVSLQDSGNNVVTIDNSTVVTASVSAGATLVGTRTATASSGVATFDDLGITGTAGTAYTITYSATYGGNALTVATQSVTPTVGAATQIAITTQPVGATAGALLSTQPVIKVLDSGSNVVTTASASIDVSASGGTLGGTTTVATSSGVATFTNLTFAGTATTNYTLTFAATGYTSQISSSFSVGVGAATKLVLTTSAATAKYGQAFTTQPVVKVQDAGSNVVTASSAMVTASLSSGTVVGTGNATSSSGVATFSGLGITGSPGSYTITYASGSLTTTSQTLTVNKADQTVTFADPADRAWSPDTFVLSPSASSGLTVTLTSSTTSVCTVLTLTVAMLREGTCTLTATQAGNDNFNAASSVTQSFSIGFATQATLSVSSSSTITYGSTMTLATSGGSSVGLVSYGVTGDCTISGTALTATGSAAATCVVTATKAGDTQYVEATATQTVTIAKSPSNSITFSSIGDRLWSASTFTLSPSATSGDTPALTSTTTGVCTVSSLTITMVSSGTCSLTASEDGNGNYLAATDVVRSFVVSRVTPSAATWADVTATYGDADQLMSPPTVSFGGTTVGGAWTFVSSDTTVVSLVSSTMIFGNFGSATITGSFTPTDTGKYNNVVATLNVSVGKIRPLFTWAPVSKTFGDASFGLTAPTVTNSVPGSWSYSSATDSVVSTSGSTATVVGAGTSTITATFTPTDATNYVSAGTVSMTVTVEKATPTFSWAGVSATFGDANSAIVAPTVATTAATGTWAYSSATTLVVAISGSDLDFGNAGSSVVTATFTPSNTTNYVSGGSATMTVTISQADQAALSVASTNGTYGTALTLTTSGGTTDGSVTWLVADGSATSCAVTSGALSASTIGTCTVTAIMAGSSNYKSVTSLATAVTLAQRSITVTAENKNKIYGEADPSLTYEVTTGNMAGSDTLSGSLTRLSGVNAGDYSITQGNLTNSNYAITFVPGTLTIGRKPITVTAADKTKQYGETDPALTYSITNGATLVAGDSFAGALSRAGGAGVGTHAIQQGALALSNNYTLTFVGATLTIEARDITVTADVKTKQYGEADPALTYEVTTGTLVLGDSFSGALVRNPGASVGTYTITQGTLALSANYNLAYVSADLTVTAKPITITANTLQTKVYGETDPTFDYAITSGSLEIGDVLSGSLSRSSGSTVGTYALNIGTLENSNYNISFVPANFAITTRPITITAGVKTKVHGQSDPSLTFTVTSGSLVGSDALSGSLSRVSGDDAGTYAITRGTVANSDYAITYVGANLTIERATQDALSVTTSQITYGTSVVLGSSGGSGTGDVSYAVSSSGSAGCSIADGTLSATGGVGTTCTVAVTKAQSANHNEATSSAATITVINRAITVTATSARKNYGDTDPELLYTITSGALVAGDTLSGALDRASGESVGTRSITLGTLANANYTITYVGANLTIDPRPITVRADNKTKVFGQPDPQLTYEITSGNLIVDDTLSGSISRNSGDNIGSYAIGRGNLAHSSYAVTFIDATLSVTGADQTGFILSAASTSIIFGDSTELSTIGGNGDGAVTYAVTDGTGGCTISGDTITAVDAGTCIVTATKAQEGNYNSATSNDLTINVARRAQVITFAQPADRNFTTASFSLAPTADSGNAVSLASQTTNVCTVSGLSVTMLNSGTCELVASVGGTSNYNAAPDVTRSFVISPVVPYAPILNSLTASDGAISASFALGSSGGSALLNHEYSLDNGVTWAAWPTGSITSPLNIGGLTNGVEYEVMVRAINIVGPGAASNMLAITPVAPIIVPSAPAPTASVDSTSTTVVSSTTTVFVVTTVTRNPGSALPTTTVARRAVTTTISQRNGQLTTTTTIRLTTTTTGVPTTTVERVPASAQRTTQTTTQNTIQTQTSVFESISPLAPVTRVPDTIPPSLAPTKSAAVVDGFAVSMDVRRVNNEQVVATLGESTMTMMSLSGNGAPEPLLTNGSIAVTAGGTVRVSGTGMLPAEPIEVWMYSTPVKLGEVIAGADGSFSAELLLPADASLGAHKLQFVGKKVDGAEMVFAQGISVVDDTVLTMNRAGVLDSATADNLGKDNVVSISTMNKGDAANIMLWFLVIMILVAGLLAAQPRRKSIALSPVQRIEIATPWLAGMRLPRMLMLLVGVLAGFGAANSASFSATAPSTLWVAVLIIVGLLDVMAGGVAGLVFAISVIAGGSVGSTLDIRITALVVLIATLPNVIGRAARPHGARFAVQSAITTVLNVTVVVSLISLFAPVGGVNYELSAWLVELSWVAALASAGRFALLRITQSSNDHYDAHMPALRVVGVVSAAAFVVGTNVATIWTFAAIAVLAVVVIFGLRIRVGLSVQHVRKVFVGSIAMSLALVIAATGTLIPRGSSDEVTNASQITPISELNVIGQLDVLIDGYPRTFVAINTGVGEITFINGSLGQSLTIESWSKNNERIPLASGNKLHLVRGEQIVIRANGYAANETMDAWLFSNPVFVGNAPTNGDGKLETRFVVPVGRNDGLHTLQIRLVGQDGKVVSYSIPAVLSSVAPNTEA